MASDKKPRLTLIRGGGATTGVVRRSFVALDTTLRPQVEPTQLELGTVPARRGRIVSLGFDGLEFHEFQRILKITGVRSIIDTRILAAFRRNGFRPHIVERLFEELHIEYERIRALQNPFSVTELGASVAQERYADYLREQSQILHELGRRAERGPLLLLGRVAEHCGSEREAISEEMARLGISFDLSVVRRLGNTLHLVPSATAMPHVERKEAAGKGGQRNSATNPAAPRRARSPKKKAPGTQEVLPFAMSLAGDRT